MAALLRPQYVMELTINLDMAARGRETVRQVSLSMTPSLVARVDAIAHYHQQTRSAMVAFLLDRIITSYERDPSWRSNTR